MDVGHRLNVAWLGRDDHDFLPAPEEPSHGRQFPRDSNRINSMNVFRQGTACRRRQIAVKRA
jgi:hypothetical protein